uniref:Ig-like domain-containing protein n=1 Tax=Varanus komodoensis TaxID=61221 RepID=A0A8D2J799_VARKO
ALSPLGSFRGQTGAYSSRHGTGFQCNCSLCASPSPKIKWQVDGETLEGNTTKGPLEVTTWTKEEVATSTLHFTGLWNGKQRITCLGSNLKGELPVMFFLFRSGMSLECRSVLCRMLFISSMYRPCGSVEECISKCLKTSTFLMQGTQN